MELSVGTIILAILFLGLFIAAFGAILFAVFSSIEHSNMEKSFCADIGGDFATDGWNGIFCDGQPFVCSKTSCYFVDHSFVGGN